MVRVRMLYSALFFLMLSPTAFGYDSGKVKIPLGRWEQMKTQVESDTKPTRPGIAFCPIERSITGSFDKGLFSATLIARFEVLDDNGHIRVPVLDSGASVDKVTINGKRTSLLRQGPMYTLGIDDPGVYTVEVKFFWGHEQVDFSRKLKFRVPEAGVTRLKIRIPEVDIEPKLSSGALIGIEPRGGATTLTGALDASGLVNLAWRRKLTHRSSEKVQLQARLNTVFTVGVDMITGLSVFDLRVINGETDRVDLRLPDGLEVVGVDGDAVLQWYTDSTDGGKLAVLLRYLVQDQVHLAIHFQFPSEEGTPVELAMPLPGPAVAMEGALGVQGPAGLNLQIAGVKNAEQLNPRDLPLELTALTPNPLQHGFSFYRQPHIRAIATRHGQVQVTSTLIDELQASTVVIEDGTEISKMKLRVRNHTAQYLSLILPPGAQLTHSLIDGVPIRPATGKDKNELLLPLRQSERISSGTRRSHVVRQGETLSDIANFYYSDPKQWDQILDSNPDLADEFDLSYGQRLIIPAKRGVKVEESSFVIELAYKHPHKKSGALGYAGSREFSLPRIKGALPEARQVEVMRAVWHLYLPKALDALSFETNFTQYSYIRYNPFTRIREFLSNAFFARAWAGGRYRSILTQRKGIFIADNARKTGAEAVLANFPLVGRQYRFKRTLLGTETPRISVTYAAGCIASPVRWLTFFIAFLIVYVMLRKRRSWLAWIATVFCTGVVLIVAHYFLGVHRRLLWGVDVALLTLLIKNHWGHCWKTLHEILWSPWQVHRLLTWTNLAFLIGLLFILWFILILPVLLSSTTLVVLSFWYIVQKYRVRKDGEVPNG